MFKRMLISTGAGAALLLGACEDATAPRPECTPVFNTLKETRGDTVVTTNGLRYIETHTGTGGTVVSCRYASVSFRGTLLDGSEFQAIVPSYPVYPGSGTLVAGFEQGVVGMRVGGTRRIIIPPSLAYGAQGATNQSTGAVIIPPNATVVFDIGANAVE